MKSFFAFVVSPGIAIYAAEDFAVTPQLDIWQPGVSTTSTVRDLHNAYYDIFKHGSRNAASHLWSTFLFERAHQMSEAKFEEMSSGYCAVSGSPVHPNDYKRYRLTLDKVNGGTHTGFMYYCCWPCVCDTQDFIKIDTKNVTTAEGTRQYHFAVIGNPCDHAEVLSRRYIDTFERYETSLQEQAAEVRCGPDGELLGATISDNGYIIIAMFFDALGGAAEVKTLPDDGSAQPGRVTNVGDTGLNFQDEREWAEHCKQRAEGGYKSGMGEIFRKVAGISQIQVPASTALPGGNTKSNPPCDPANETCLADEDK